MIMKHKILSFVLAALMVAGPVGMIAFADTSDGSSGTSEMKTLVAFVNLKDETFYGETFFTADTIDDYMDDLENSVPGGTYSVKEYISAYSKGAVDLTFDTVIYNDANNYQHYSEYDMAEWAEVKSALLAEICSDTGKNVADYDMYVLYFGTMKGYETVDFYNGDPLLESGLMTFNAIYRGFMNLYAEDFYKCIAYKSGVLLSDLSVPSLSDHEEPMGDMDLFANSVWPVQTSNVYFREKVGWLTERQDGTGDILNVTRSGTYTLNPSASGTSDIAIKLGVYKTEFFMIEYKMQADDTPDMNIMTDGLIIYRVNTEASGNSGGLVDDYEISVLKSSKVYDAEDKYMMWVPGQTCSDFTYSNGQKLDASITNIVFNVNGTVTFDLKVGDVVTPAAGGNNFLTVSVALALVVILETVLLVYVYAKSKE
jgi:hypothetical protein